MKDLIIKEVDFQSNKIIAISENGKIYVSVSSVCTNLGMNKNLKDTQVKKVQEDELLKGASKLTHLKTNGGIQETLVIELDYLPAWLFKINPSKFNKELKEKLMIYQLKAKDVLSDAFFGKRINEHSLENYDWGLDRVVEIADEAREIEGQIIPYLNKLKSLYGEMETIAELKGNYSLNNFLSFKKDKEKEEDKDTKPERVIELEIEKENLDKINELGLDKDKVLENTVKILGQQKLSNKE